MSQRLVVLMMALLVSVVLTVGPVLAQEARDRVELTSGAFVNGKVLEESWKGVKLDKDLDGKADEVIALDKVKDIVYGDQPKYMKDAILLRPKADQQQEYIDTLKRAYFDKTSSKWILQHAYYDIAKEYEKLSVTNGDYVPKTLEAYQKLLDDIPDSRYAPQLRTDLGDMFLARGELEQARKNFQGAIGSGFGPDIETKARFRQAETFLIENKPDQADSILTQVKTEGLGLAVETQLTVMKADVMAARGQYDKAYETLTGVLSGRKAASIEPQAYMVLGDVFRLQDKPQEALLSYLRVHLMYEDVDPVTHARALVGAIKVCKRLNRKDEARELQSELEKAFPGSLWESKLN